MNDSSRSSRFLPWPMTLWNECAPPEQVESSLVLPDSFPGLSYWSFGLVLTMLDSLTLASPSCSLYLHFSVSEQWSVPMTHLDIGVLINKSQIAVVACQLCCTQHAYLLRWGDTSNRTKHHALPASVSCSSSAWLRDEIWGSKSETPASLEMCDTSLPPGQPPGQVSTLTWWWFLRPNALRCHVWTFSIAVVLLFR